MKTILKRTRGPSGAMSSRKGHLFALVIGIVLGPAWAWSKACEYPIADLSKCASRTPRKDWVPRDHVNGCGTQGGWFPVPDSFGRAQFLSACNNHDACYGTCNSVRAECDRRIKEDIRTICSRVYTPGSIDLNMCLAMAAGYKSAVRVGGSNPYEDGQKLACECCTEERFYCPCNKTCYSNISSCAGSCSTSMGCYTEICAVAKPGQCKD